MFITYALSIGCAVALLGLFLEWAGQRKWPTRRKMWGSLILTIGALGIAPIISNHAGPLPVAAACSCLTLALSLRGSHQEVTTDIQPEYHLPSAAVEIMAEEAPVLAEDIAVLEEVDLEEEVVLGEEAVLEEEVVLEAEVILEEEGVLEEEAVLAEESPSEEVYIEPAPAAVLTEEMAEWLNIRISEGYEAKGNGLWAEAATAFEAAVAVCADLELKGMLEEELQDCLAQLPAPEQTNVLQAS